MISPALPVTAVTTMAAFCLLATIASAEETCRTTDGDDNCVRLLACVGDAGRWFDGTAIGRGDGTLSGTMSDGVICTGTWTNSNAFGFGEATVNCTDGADGVVLYALQDGYTGTAIGRGEMTTGAPISAWSGENVLDYLSPDGASGGASLPCTAGAIPIS